MNKICTVCGQEKEIDLFVKKAKSPDGHASECKDCHNKHNKDVYYRDIEKSREKGRTTSASYKKRHPDRVKENAKKEHVKNKDKYDSRIIIYRSTHKDEINTSKREYAKKHPEKVKKWHDNAVKKNGDKYKDTNKRYKKENKERLNKLEVERRNKNPQLKIAHSLRNSIGKSLKSKSELGRTPSLIGCSIDSFCKYLESLFTDGMTWKNYGQGNDKWTIDHTIPLVTFDLENEEQQKIAFHWSNMKPMWQRENFSKGSLHNGVRHHRKKAS